MHRPDEFLDIYVVWRLDEDHFFTTRVSKHLARAQLESGAAVSTRDLVAAAHDLEYPPEEWGNHNPVRMGRPFDCAAIFWSDGPINFPHCSA